MTRSTRPNANPSTYARVRVHLRYSQPRIWRLIDVDSAFTLEQFHTVLQEAMGWENSHLHLFSDTDPDQRWSRRMNRSPRRWGPPFLSEDDSTLHREEDWIMSEVLTQDSGPLYYEYDLGDRWVHRIDFVETRPKAPADPRARVLRGKRRCPLEDSGGIGGYEELLDVLADHTHPDHRELTEWATGSPTPEHPFNPAAFDLAAINEKLRAAFPAQARVK